MNITQYRKPQIERPARGRPPPVRRRAAQATAPGGGSGGVSQERQDDAGIAGEPEGSMHIELIERPRARRRDPATSHDAAKKAERFARSHAGRILAVFQSNATFTWTAHELATQTGLSIVQIDRRLNEMPQIERAGFALDGFTAWRLRAGV